MMASPVFASRAGREVLSWNTVAGAVLAAWLLVLSPRAGALDANTASADELCTIHGIGPALSARIVNERSRTPFGSLEDLASRVRGVGPASLRRMRDAGLQVGPSGRVATFSGQRRGASGIRKVDTEAADTEAARRVQRFVGQPAPIPAAHAPVRDRAQRAPSR